jgi:large subunit ribosomal protein L5
MAKVESGKGGKTSERRPPKKKEGSSAPQAMDEGSEESKFKPRMRESYLQKVVPALMKEFGYKNIMQVPKLERIVLNVGMGEAIQNVKLLESAAGELGAITGQKPLITKAKKAIASFKLRQGMPIGTKVRILPNHACATASQHELYNVVSAGSDAIEAQWPRMRGW